MLNRQIIKERRDYNTWVANETLEDYSLRYAPQSFRKWSEFLVANTALGGISFLALEAIGSSLVINYGFTNSFWAIITVGIIIFLAGIPISYYCSTYNIDIDLLTRGAGFGYIGSTITSLIYASFTFIFFALEAAIMAQAINLYFNLPLAWGYIICSLVIIPIVFYGVTLINKLQLWTQPIWLILMVTPYIFVLHKEPHAVSNWLNFAGNSASGNTFDPLLFGSAATVSFSLIAQLGEQVDYLRFLPNQTKTDSTTNKLSDRLKQISWWLAVILAGPGWIILGMAKQLGGAFLTTLAIDHGFNIATAKQPIFMYLAGFSDVFSNPDITLAVATLFVIISQIKINVTNAYAGSLAWSNFFSRMTHSHPGRVVWLIFNVAIALLLMELGVFETLEAVLGLYSNVAIAWIGALVADLVINKPLGISPSYIEFKRAYLYNFNPVGFGSMVIASIVSMLAFVGLFGAYPQAYAPFIALGLAFVLSPIIAFATQGKYYLARPNIYRNTNKYDSLDMMIKCCICETKYEATDTAFCPIYDGPICSLCCSLDARCHDNCKTVEISDISSNSKSIFQEKLSPLLGLRLTRFIEFFLSGAGILAVIFGLVYYQSFIHAQKYATPSDDLLEVFIILYSMLLVLVGIATWWFILSDESRELAEAELDKQNLLLEQQIADRKKAQGDLLELTHQLEKRVVERTAKLSEALLNLKRTQAQLIQSEKMSSLGQLVAGIAHEINNPISFIQGNLIYAIKYVEDLLNLVKLYQLEMSNSSPKIDEYLETIEWEFIEQDLPKLLKSMEIGTERIKEIVLSLRIFSRLDESDIKEVNIHDGIESTLMILGHRLKQSSNLPKIVIIKDYAELPLVKCYAGLLNQVFMNMIANAIDAIEEKNQFFLVGELSNKIDQIIIQTRLIESSQKVEIRIKDTGKGMPENVRKKMFDYLFTTKPVGKGTGLGLSISYQIIVEKHQGTLDCRSVLGEGTELIITIPLIN